MGNRTAWEYGIDDRERRAIPALWHGLDPDEARGPARLTRARLVPEGQSSVSDPSTIYSKRMSGYER